MKYKEYFRPPTQFLHAPHTPYTLNVHTTHTVIIDGFGPELLVVTLRPHHLQYDVGVDDFSLFVTRLGQLLATDHLGRGRLCHIYSSNS